MKPPEKPKYDFKHPVFQQKRQYRRWAKEHINLYDLRSDVISWEVATVSGPLKIPNKYHIHYRIRSIVSIDEEQLPIYGSYHIMELTLPPNYPLEPCKIYLLTPSWHPNIKSDGPYKGRICGNFKNFGKTYDLYQLILRVGEILQYKNYHAVHTPPYPEDSLVARWVTGFAEPNGIVDKNKEIYVDDTPLIVREESEITPDKVKTPNASITYQPKSSEIKDKPPLTTSETPETLQDHSKETTTEGSLQKEKLPPARKRIRIGTVRKSTTKLKLSIKKRDSDFE